MEVKEAIEFLEKNMYIPDELKWYDIHDYLNKKNQVISLLQQGEKYRQMWGIFKNYLYNYEGDAVHRRNYKDKLNQIEQKYFPKEASHDYPEGEE